LQLHDIIGVGMTDPKTQFSANFRNIVDTVIERNEFEAAYQYQPPKRGLFGRTDGVVIQFQPPAQPPPVANDTARAKSAAPQQNEPPRLDYAKAAKIIAKHAEESGFRLIGKERVRKLISSLPGFIRNGRPWGGVAYYDVLQALKARDPRFSVERLEKGGVVLAFDGNGARGQRSASSA
jgi:hypothetical protein